MKIVFKLVVFLLFNLKLIKMKEKIKSVLNWVITIATALTVFLDKLPMFNNPQI